MILFETITSFLKDKDYRDLLLTSTVVLGFGTLVYRLLEGWNWIDSLYFSVITLTTIGYGDFSPKTDAGKLFTIIYILIGLGMILTFIHTVYNHYDHIKTKTGNKNNKKN